MIQYFIQSQDIKKIVMDVLNDSLRFVEPTENLAKERVIFKKWAEFMKGIGKLHLITPKPETSLAIMLNWLKTSVAPSLKILQKLDETFHTNMIEEVIDSAKLNDRHYKQFLQYKTEYEIQKQLLTK